MVVKTQLSHTLLEYAAQPGDVEDVIDAKNNDH